MATLRRRVVPGAAWLLLALTGAAVGCSRQPSGHPPASQELEIEVTEERPVDSPGPLLPPSP